MATNLENLETIKSNLLTALASITASPKPTYSIDGQSVSWGDYYRSLMDQVKAVNELINMESPYIVVSQVM